ncbi:50S ribosomal protein L44e [Candidatus Woesearchaeota archaeon]|nr:50S ribosomal protein L44e [Candidatus Woesearchaeota archaeon]
MKLPKTANRYCPYCKHHTEHKILLNKKRAPSSLSRGSKYRARKRGKARGFGNLGRYSKPAVTQFKMTGAKTTKKTDLRYECTACKKQHVQRYGIRAKRVEFVQ